MGRALGARARSGGGRGGRKERQTPLTAKYSASWKHRKSVPVASPGLSELASERRLGEYRDLEAAYPQTGGADPAAAPQALPTSVVAVGELPERRRGLELDAVVARPVISGRSIISRSALDAWMLFLQRVRAEHSC